MVYFTLMIKSFGDVGTEDIWEGVDSKAARQALPKLLWRVGVRKLEIVDLAKDLKDIAVPPANRLEKLKANYAGKYSIRINDQYRVIFAWEQGDAMEVQIFDYH